MSSSTNPLAKGSFWIGIVLLILGIILIISAKWAIITSITLDVLIGLFLIIGGLVLFFASFGEKKGTFWAMLLLGILMVIVGVFLFMNPVEGTLFLTSLLAILFVIGGVLKIIFSFYLPGEGKFIFILSGIVSILLALFIWLTWPFSGIWFLGFLVGIDILILGIAQIVLSFQKN